METEVVEFHKGHVPYDFAPMYTVLGHLHVKVSLLILFGQFHLKMNIYCLGVKIVIDGREEVLAFEIQLYVYLQLLGDSIYCITVI